MNNKGIIVSIIVLIILAGGIYFLMNQASTPATIPTSPDTGTTATNPSSTPSDNTSTSVNSETTNPAANPNPAPATPAPAASTPTTYKVTIQNFAFNQSSLTVKKGDTVTWTNQDSMGHTVTGDNGGPSSSTLSQGQSYSYTFTSTGTFPYHCAIHPSMKGTVTVTS